VNGSAIPNGADTEGWLRYSNSNPGTCSDSFGTRVPYPYGYTDLGSGTSGVLYAYAISGLTPVTTYYVCAIASNSYGTEWGSVVSFTTTAAAPTVTTNVASPTTGTTAQLNGLGNPGGADTTGWFHYDTTNPGTCNDTFGTRVPASGGTDLGSGTSGTSFNQSITGLTPNTTYYFCALVSNSAGSAVGSVLTFTTPIPPVVTTTAASYLSNTTAQLNGSATPNNAATTGWFRYAATSPGTCNDMFGSRTPASGGVNLGSGTNPMTYAEAIGGLSPGTTYYFCAIASNSEGTGFGSVLSFTTANVPTVTTEPATSVAATSALLNASDVPNGADTSSWFRYSTTNPVTCSDSFGTRVPTYNGDDLGSGTSAMADSQYVAAFVPNTTYYFCAIASNVYGTSWGSVVSFTTPAQAPVVTTSAATNLTATTAQLNGLANPGGADTAGWFRYDLVSPGTCNDTFGTRAPAMGGTDLGAGTVNATYNQTISGLTAGTTYYFCAIGSNSVGTAFGAVLTFTTPVPPTVVTNPASNIADVYAYLYGSANPNSGTATGWFRIDTTNPGTCNDAFGTRVPSSGGNSLGSGTVAVSYNDYASGLTANTTYYFCAIASNTAGTGFGAVLSFTTVGPPIVTTQTPTSVTSTSALLNATANPNTASTYGWFRYYTVNPGTCSDSGGIRVPSSSGWYLGYGSAPVSYSQTTGSLTPNSTYYVCAFASSSYGTGAGAVVTFATPAALPSVITNAPSSLTGTTATLSGSANPNGADTTGWFRYDTTNPVSCNDMFGTRVPSMSGTDLGPGVTSASFSQAITGLTAGTTYYYCALASNSVATATGAVVTFTTPLVPVVTTNAASSIANTSAYLNGVANPNNAAATGWFRYSTTNPGTCDDMFGSRAPTSGGNTLGSGGTGVVYSTQITNLSPATTYYFCAIASNSQGTGFGAIQSFVTLAPPTANTGAITSLTAISAVLNGSGLPNGADTTGWFRYSTTFPGGCSDSFGARVPLSGGTDLGTGTTSVAYMQTISGLIPNTTYYYCAIDSNAYGTAFGAISSFVTNAAAPTVTTNSASGLTGTAAQLNGTADPGGADAIAWFRYSTASPGTCNDMFGTRVPSSSGTDLGAGNSNATFSQVLSSLTPGTTYYFCALASNSAGSGVGAVLQFTTPLPPAITSLAATPITATTATLNGYGAGNGYATTGWFRYDTNNPGSCNDSFGTRVPSSSGLSLGSSGSSYSEMLSNLEPGTLYYFCAIGSSAVGTGLGSVLSFTTASTQPTVTTLASTGITSSTATLNGSAVPNGDDTTAWFRYDTTSPGTCNDGFGTRVPASGGTDLGSGNAAMPWSQMVSGLSYGVTYYFCAIASNAIATSFGTVLSFNTALPTVTTQAATAVSGTTATLNGSANPNSLTTTGWFRYSATNPGSCSDSFGTRVPLSGGTSLGSGSSPVPYLLAINGLSHATTYYFCALASSSSGTGLGSVLSFTTAGPPTVITNAAMVADATDATLNGSANPDGADTTGWFRYDVSNPGSCNDNFGTRVPPSGGTDVGSGTMGVGYAQSLSGLTPGTTYYACALASNTYGTATGSVVSFMTPAAAPVVSTIGGTPLSGTTAQLNGSANPGGADTTAWFRYDTSNPGTCDDVFGTPAPVSGGTDLGAGNSTVPFSQNIFGLTPATTYFFCAIARSSVGEVYGTIGSFTTLELPSVTTTAASGVAAGSATLNGSANPDGTSTTGWFRYDVTNPGSCSDSFGTRAPVSGGSSLGAGTSQVPYSQAISGLAPLTTYYYCAIASSAAGEGYGSILSFTTGGPPSVTTSAATSVAATAAVLNGSATPNGGDTNGWFRYSTTNPGSCSDAFGTRAPSSGGTDVGTGSSAVPFSESISGLAPGATYFACALASNAYGTATGSLVTFTTSAAVPVVTTVDAIPLSGTSAQVDGSANPGGGDTTGWFRYDTSDPGICDDSFGTRVPGSGGTDLGSGNTSAAFGQTLSGLTPGTTYYVCAIASNASGTSFGAVLSFTAPLPPAVTTSAASAVTNASATLNGVANPNGAATTGWFRYDTTNPGTCSDAFGTRVPASGGMSLGSGSSASGYSQIISGLSPLTTYYFCALASSIGGVSSGAVLSFTTPTGPTIATTPATMVTSTTATLNGAANPNRADTTGWFRYDTSNPGSCSDAFGTRSPASGGMDLGSGSSVVRWSQPLSGLTPGTTYYFCALGSNAYGTATGAVQSFATPPEAPVVTTVDGTPLSGSTARLDGTANPGGGDTTAWFRYDVTNPGTCDDVFGTRVPSSGATDVGAGNSAVAYSDTISGLTPGTTYYVCAIGSNSAGTAFGSVVSFIAPVAPIVVTDAGSAIVANSATLNGTANPGGADTVGWFRYDVTNPGTCDDMFGTRVPASGGTDVGTGTSPAAFSQPISGLLQATTYYFCALASSAGGLATGAVLSFTTPTAPAVTTLAATSLTSGSAVLNGSGNPQGADATGWFRYDTTNPGSCSDSFGTRAPPGGGMDLGAGSGAVPWSQPISGLTPGTTYYFCALASNADGTSSGAVLTFTTAVAAPAVTTVDGSPLSGTTAQLDGTANPDGGDTTGWFRYDLSSPGTCNDGFGTRVPANGGTDVGSGNAPVAFSQVISALIPGTTYYVCAIASNTAGTSFGLVVSFTTPSLPTVTTSAASAIAGASATLNGASNPNGTAATGWFRYDVTNPMTCNDTFGTRVPSSGGTALGAGSADVSYLQPITGLSPNTTYYFCAIASNAGGTAFGSVLSFTTPSAPSVITTAATGVTSAAATLNGTGTPNGADTTGWFRYDTMNPGSCNDSFGTRVPAGGGTDLGSGASAVPWSQSLSALAPGTTYYFCALASNAYGTVTGAILTFTTQAAVPTVTTVSGAADSGISAELEGAANPNGADTTGWFRYDTSNPGTCNDSFGTRIPVSGGTDVGSGTSGQPFTQEISGLSPGTTYYFCAIGSNADGTAFGAVLSFATPVAPTVLTSAASSVVDVSATLNGLANPEGNAATGWFRYDLTNPGTCNDSFGTRVPAVGGTSLGSGSSAVPWSEPITGLTQGTTYYFCALASSAGGTGTGAVLTFTTLTAPAVTTALPTQVTYDSATLEGSVNPDGSTTTGWFRYDVTNPGACSDTFGVRAPTTAGNALGSGTSTVSTSQAISGLSPSTTYYFCAIAANAYGTGFGGVLSFTTRAASSSVTTVDATQDTAVSAQLNGSANPNGADTTGWFRYDTMNPGTCSDSFGTRAPSAGGTDLGSGISAVPWSQTINGLTPGTTYFFCALASNSLGVATGAVVSFTTPPAVPVVTTVDGTPLSGTSAQLDGSAVPGGGDTTGWFRYDTMNPGTCDDVFGTRMPASGGTDLGSGNSARAFSQTISGLAPGTTYYACAIAANASGAGFGSIVAFSTPVAPMVVTSAPTSVADVAATLNGTGNPAGTSATGWFRYAAVNPGTCSDSFGTRVPAAGGLPLGSGMSPQPFSQTITGLTPGTTYYFCAIASSSGGLGTGAVLSFTTLAPPVVVTAPATQLMSAAATLNGAVNPNGADTTSWFRYGTTNPGTCNDAFGTRAPAGVGVDVGSGNSAVPVAQPISGLMPATEYYFCAIAANAYGTAFGSVLTFTTSAGAPIVTTTAATQVSGTSVVLNGSANPDGADAQGWFRYDTTDPGTCSQSFGTRAPASGGTDLGSGLAATSWSQAVTGLTPGTTYYFCALAFNAFGASTGSVLTFTTPAQAPVVTTVGGMALSGSTAQLDGLANPGGGDTLGWFRYDTTSPGACNDAFGTRTPPSGGTDLGSGNGAEAFSQTISGLLPVTTYYLCAIASNVAGTSFGTVFSFTTLAGPPVVTTEAATQVMATSAELNGSAIPDGADATGWFRYDTTNPGACSDSFGTRTPSSDDTDLGTGQTAIAFAQVITGLQPSTTYFFCAISSSSAGTATGTVLSFTTAEEMTPPTVTTQAASGITSTEATLNGTVAANFAATAAWFRYSATDPGTCDDAFGTRLPATGQAAFVSAGTIPVGYSEVLTGLSPGTTWYYCAIASNSQGTSFGPVFSFTTSPDLPVVTTSAPTNLLLQSGTLNGSANPNGADATGWFRYDSTNPGACDDAFGQRAPATGGVDLGAGTAPNGYSEMVSDLVPGTTYYACAIAANSVGMAFGDVIAFTTGAVAPVVTTTAATDVMGTTATLAGAVNPNGLDSLGWFRYGTTQPTACSDAFGDRAPASGGAPITPGTSAVPFTQPVMGLAPNTTYYYCAAASNAGGAAFGDVLSFQTGAVAPVVTTAAPALGAPGSATLNGSANPNGSAATGWFRYGSAKPDACDDSFGTAAPASGDGQSIGDGLTPVPFSESVSGLTPGTWYACAIASNAAGKSYGDIASFVVPATPHAKAGCACGTGTPGDDAILWILPMLRIALLRRRRSTAQP
jgi:hypothetical protein